MIKKELFLIAALLLPVFFSCEKEPAPVEGTNGVTLKVSLENGRNWNKGDQVWVNGTSYKIAEETGTPNSTVPNVEKASEYFAAYNFGEGTFTENQLTLDLPKTIGPDHGQVIPMVGYSDSENLMLRNLLGFLKLKLSGNATITRINLTSNNPEMKLSGAAEIDMDLAATPQIRMAAGADTNLALDFGKEGLQLSEEGTVISIPLPPAKYEEGIKFLIYDNEGKAMEENIDYAVEVKRGEEKTLPQLTYTPGSDAPAPISCTLENDAFGKAGVWAVSDAINVNGGAYNLISGEGTATAAFGPVLKADSYVIVSPSKAYYGYAENFARLSIPAEQQFNVPMNIANPQVGITTGETATLKYTAGVIAVKISGNNIIDNIQLASKDKSKGISGKMDVTFSGDGFTTKMNNGSGSSITLSCPGGATTEGGKLFTFVVPEGEYTQGFKIVLTNSRQQMHVVETPAVSVKRNEKTVLADIDWETTAEDSGNLSNFGWANCYIVSSEGKYSFDTKLVDGTLIKDIAKVDWLWANSVKGDAKSLLSDISYKSGKVTFKASAQEGNVLLAAFNSANEIVWSWHIWMTDEPKTINMENMSPKDPSKGFFLMDRNLGATSAAQADGEETYGFFYQWGRKDPFYGGTKEELVNVNGDITSKEPFKNAATGTVCNTKYAQAKWQAEEGNADNGNMEFAIKNPMFFLAGNRTAGDNNWLAKGNTFRKDYYAEDSKLWNPFKKTNYDPCPAGYRIPRQGTWDELGTNRGKWATDYSGFIFTSTSGESTWFPAQGLRMAHPDEGGALYRLDSGIKNWIAIWTSDLSTGGTSCQSNSLNISTTETNTQASFDPWGNGLNVRCVKNYEY